MANGVIDLRKRSVISENGASAAENLPEKIEWEAYEYEHAKRGKGWFLATGIPAAILAIVGIVAENYFFAAFLALAFLTLAMFAFKEGRKIFFAVDKNGVKVGGKSYPFAELKSFWIFSRGNGKELSLATSYFFSPFVRIPLEETDADAIKNLLEKFIPEEKHQEFLTDEIARRI